MLLRTHAKETKLRREGDHRSEVIVTLPPGTEVEVLEEHGHYLKVRCRDHFNNYIGYVPSGFLAEEQSEKAKPRAAQLLPCPRCGAITWVIFPLMSGHAPTISLGFLSFHTAKARICQQCGYLEYCVDEAALADIKAKVELDKG